MKSCGERCKARWNLVYCDLRTEMDGGFMKISRKKSHMLLVVVVAGIFAAASACLAVLGSFHLQNCRQRPVTAGSEPRVRISAEAGAKLQRCGRSSDRDTERTDLGTGSFGAKKRRGSGTLDLCRRWLSAFGVGEIRRDGFCKGRKKDHAASVDGSANYRVGSFRNFDAERIGFGCMPGLDPGDRRRK